MSVGIGKKKENKKKERKKEREWNVQNYANTATSELGCELNIYRVENTEKSLTEFLFLYVKICVFYLKSEFSMRRDLKSVLVLLHPLLAATILIKKPSVWSVNLVLNLDKSDFSLFTSFRFNWSRAAENIYLHWEIKKIQKTWVFFPPTLEWTGDVRRNITEN